MVIDDHTASKAFLVEALGRLGFAVVGEGDNGAAAVDLAAAVAPDVILMAVGLRGMDGIKVAQAIMEAKPLPIVLLTSHHDPATIERAKGAGIMAYLIKPLREEELRPAIELAISRFSEFASLRSENAGLKKTLKARKVIERAKGILMQSQGLSEAQAFALIQRKSMMTRKPMAEIGQAIVLAEEIAGEKRA